MKKMYLVSYSTGSYEDFDTHDIFITYNKKVAIKYVKKFNSILKKWKDYYSKYEEPYASIRWIKDEYVDIYFDRWMSLRETNECFYNEIEVR